MTAAATPRTMPEMRVARRGRTLAFTLPLGLLLSSGCAGVIPLPDRVLDKGRAPADERARIPVRAGEAAGERGTRSPTTGLARKTVSSKEGPSTLVADDGSRCTVDAERFEKARAGDDVWCLWRGTNP